MLSKFFNLREREKIIFKLNKENDKLKLDLQKYLQ